MELFEQIRREYEHGEGTIRGVARKYGSHRRMVREAIASALPQPRKKTERRHLKLQAAIPFIDQILQGDRQAPRKQRHTAHRIWERLRAERVALCVFVKTKEAHIEWPFAGRTPHEFAECLAKVRLVAEAIRCEELYKRPGKHCAYCEFLPVYLGVT